MLLRYRPLAARGLLAPLSLLLGLSSPARQLVGFRAVLLRRFEVFPGRRAASLRLCLARTRLDAALNSATGTPGTNADDDRRHQE